MCFKDGTTESYKFNEGNYVAVPLEKSSVEKIRIDSGIYSKLGDFIYMLLAPLIALLPYHMFDKFTFPNYETVKRLDISFDTAEKYGDNYLLTLEKIEQKRKSDILSEKNIL